MTNSYTFNPVRLLLNRCWLLLLLAGSFAAHAQAPNWQLALGSNDPNEGTSQATATAVDAAGNVYITGSFNGQIAFGTTTLTNPNIGFQDVFVAKWNTGAGTWAWAQQGGGANNDFGLGIAVGSSGVYVTGTYRGTSSAGAQFGGATGPTLPGNGTVVNTNAFLVKYDGTSGNLQWAQYGGGGGDDTSQGVAVSGTGVYITGSYVNDDTNSKDVKFSGSNTARFGLSSPASADIFIVKYNDLGSSATQDWFKRAGGSQGDQSRAIAVSGSSVYITGSYNTNGANSNFVTFDNNPQLGNQAGNTNGPASDEVFVAKYTDNSPALTATLKWVEHSGGAQADCGNSIAVSGTDIYVTGYYTNRNGNGATVFFGSTALTNSNPTTFNKDVFIAKYTDMSTSAPVAWAIKGSGNLDDEGTGIAVSSGSLYVTGTYNNSTINSTGFQFDGASSFLPGARPSSTADVFLVKYNSLGTTTPTLTTQQHGGGNGDDSGGGIAVNGTNLYLAVSTAYEGAQFGSGPLYGPRKSAVLVRAQAGGSFTGAEAPLQGGNSEVTATTTDVAGNVYITGNFNGQVRFGNTLLTVAGGSDDVFVAKWNTAAASWAWAKQAGGADSDIGNGIAVLSGSVYVTGSYTNNNANSSRVLFDTNPVAGSGAGFSSFNGNMFLVKYNDLGTSATVGWVNSAGGSGNDEGKAIAVTSNGIYVTGSYTAASNPATNNVLFNGTQLAGNAFSSNPKIDVFVAKYTDGGSSSTLSWVTSGGSSGDDYGNGIAVSGSSVYVTGELKDPNQSAPSTTFFGSNNLPLSPHDNGSDTFVVKFNDGGSSATAVWGITGGGQYDDVANAIAVSGNGSAGTKVYITGRYDNKGFSSATWGNNVTLPTKSTQGNTTPDDVFVLKYVDNGASVTTQWGAAAGGSNNDEGQAIAVSGSNVYVTGLVKTTSTGDVKFGNSGPVAGTTPLPGSGTVANNEVFVAKYLDAGTTASLGWAQHGGGPGDDQGRALALDGQNVYVAGLANYGATFANTTLTPANTSYFLAQLVDAVLLPTLTSIVNNSGPAGTVVTLNGTNLTGATLITFTGASNNTVPAANFTVNGVGTQITGVTVPTGVQTGNVTVTTPNGISNGVLFTVPGIPAPTLLNVLNPATSTNSGPVGASVVLNGTDLTGATLITFAGTSGNTVTTGFTVDGAGMQINGVTVPSGAISGNVTVTTPGGTSNGAFFTVAPAPGGSPTITSFSPAFGLAGTLVTIYGTNFQNVIAIGFGAGATSIPFTKNAANTEIYVTAPASETSGPIVVRSNPGGDVVTATDFLYDLIISTAGQTIDQAPVFYHDITVTSTGVATLQGPTEVRGNFRVQSDGLLLTNCQTVVGAGSFTLDAGGFLAICDPAGIAALPTMTGAVQTTGVRSFSVDASYIYNGTGVQATGSGLPATVRNLTVGNSNRLDLTQPSLAVRRVLQLTSGNFALNGNALTLLSDATGTALVVNSGANVVQGTATMQRYIDPSLNPGLGYRHYSAPVTGSTVNDLSTTGFSPVVNPNYNNSATPNAVTPFPTVFGYNQSRVASAVNNLADFDKGWVSPAAGTDPLVVGHGYTVNLLASAKVDFTGTLNTGTQSVSLDRIGGPLAASGGWALVGNPYPAPIDWSNIPASDRTGLDASMYVFESTGPYAGSYRANVNGIGGNANSPNSLIASSQGFFVRVSNGQTGGILTFRDAARIVDFTVPLHRTATDTRPLVQLSLHGTTGPTDALYAYAQTGATPAFDAQYDAVKLPNSTGLNLASLATSGEKLAIDGRPVFALSTVLPLTVGVPAAGSYTIAAAALNNIPVGLDAYLNDAATGQVINLRTQASYAFTVTTAQAAALITGRFTLTFAARTALATTPTQALAGLSLYPNPAHGSATVLVPAIAGAPSATLTLTDALGRTVLTRTATATSQSVDLNLAGLAPGVYVLQVRAGAATAVRRLVVE